MIAFHAALVLGFCVFANAAAAQCVDWTPGFDRAGIHGNIRATAVFDDGTGNGPELFVGGDFDAAGDVAAHDIVKWNGTRWAALGSGRPSAVKSLVVWDDGSGPALIAGCEGFSSAPVSGTIDSIAKWDGTTWTGLPGGVAVQHVNTMLAHDDGSGPALYVGAFFSDIGGALPQGQAFARFDGSTWSIVGSGLLCNFDGPSDLCVHDFGGTPQLFASGYSLRPAASTPGAPIWRWDGTTWNNASAGWYGQAYGGPMAVVHSSIGSAALYAGGSSTISPTQQKLMLWNGSSWLAVGSDLGGYVDTLLEVPQPGSDALLYAGGAWTTFYPFLSGGLGVWSNFQWSAPAAPLDKNVSTLALYDEGSGPKLFAGLAYQTAAPDEVPLGVGRLDGAAWVTPGPGGAGEAGFIQRLAVIDDGGGPDLYACGTLAAGTGSLQGRVARLVAHVWQPIGTPFDSGVAGMRGFDDGVHGREIYACGGFQGNAGVGLNHVARWDGSHWQPLGPGIGAFGEFVLDLIAFDDGSGPSLVALVDFTDSLGLPGSYVAKWDGAQWSILGAAFDGSMATAVVHDDGNHPALYVGGSFTHAGGAGAPNVARWNGAAWTAVGNGPGAPVSALLSHDAGQGPDLYAGCSSGSALQRWDGSAWQPVPGGPVSVDALASFDDGTGRGPRLCVNGLFSSGYGACFDGTTWEPMGTGLTGYAKGIAVFDDGLGPALFVGGTFTKAGQYGATNIARFGPTGACTPTTGTLFCAGDGSGTPCPCGNSGAAQHGCAGAGNALGAALVAEGQAHLSSDTVTLRATDLPASTTLLFFQGTDQVASGLGVVFGDGLRCVGGSVVRLATRASSASTASFGHAVAGDPLLSHAGHLADTWATRAYQAWYRNSQSFCTPATFNLTNAVSIRWAP